MAEDERAQRRRSKGKGEEADVEEEDSLDELLFETPREQFDRMWAQSKPAINQYLVWRFSKPAHKKKREPSEENKTVALIALSKLSNERIRGGLAPPLKGVWDDMVKQQGSQENMKQAWRKARAQHVQSLGDNPQVRQTRWNRMVERARFPRKYKIKADVPVKRTVPKGTKHINDPVSQLITAEKAKEVAALRAEEQEVEERREARAERRRAEKQEKIDAEQRLIDQEAAELEEGRQAEGEARAAEVDANPYDEEEVLAFFRGEN